MPHRTRPMTALLLFTGLNVVLVSSITPVYDYVCFHPYWERRIELIAERNASYGTRSFHEKGLYVGLVPASTVSSLLL
ncbi:uncharacterized protein LOC104889492 isoform X1 [Beta vulgaris subsp. vulgaris]|uniref:uncharacterized protein LOC104889492 isoform X1 n=1 Tax=Beta vulgaris subsp. vulgaris TaxID=3555 RepID=UPI002036A4DC|nr:uncharacterized protein LOC104889492 isoform X1 [Beta vulgaris subsp. vulgaris]XP_048495912.1 uncharacterized protein LOC104889492 isoform X1 [Beta vulgaris subsp. vulgaris]XP_048495913.1 uncharacterized protein LOC104889492 isoform X1 [Beta vulgaris subsp. vulgaris]